MYLKCLTHPKEKYRELSEFMCFGAAPENHIHIVGEGIDNRHARIEKKRKQFLLRDLKTNFGTFINEVRIQEAILKPGDIIRMGEIEYTVLTDITKEVLLPTSKNRRWNEIIKRMPGMAQSDLPILILGPSGAGKEVISQLVHKLSGRDLGPVFTVNCSALSESLAESELFGHLKGSFTGASQDRKGAFEIAKNGTLILDEIGDLSVNLQPKLLRALENKEIKPVGSDRTIKTNVRIVACTHQNLKNKIDSGAFRLDLFYRLNVIQIQVPPLSERLEDFEDLLMTFAMEKRVRFTNHAIKALQKYRWPGNVRELKNIVSRASALLPGRLVDVGNLGELVEPTINTTELMASIKMPKLSSSNLIQDIERQIIEQRLFVNRGNQRQTAEDLGMARSTLSDRIKNYQIDIEGLLGLSRYKQVDMNID